MDDTPAAERAAADGLVPSGFPGQRLRVLPGPLVEQVRRVQPLSQLLVTDVGYFPRAERHGRHRPSGAAQTILLLCASGRGSVTLPSGRHALARGQALVIPQGTPHRYAADPDEPWTIWWLHVLGSAVPGLLDAIVRRAPEPVVTLAEPTAVVSLVETVLRRMEQDETTTSLIAASGAAWHAFTLLAAERRLPGRAVEDPVAATLDHLRADLSQRRAVAELAAMAGLSASHFATRFRRLTGQGVLEYQTRLRMARARELLATTDRTVGSIARELGYDDPLYFSRQFHRLHSLSPTQHRAQVDAAAACRAR